MSISSIKILIDDFMQEIPNSAFPIKLTMSKVFSIEQIKIIPNV